jgi:propanediol dehydratase large subunit
MFGPSNFNAEDIDDFLAMQRDWGIDGGLRTVPAGRIAELRRDAAEACRAVYRHLGLADFTDEHVARAVDAAGSKDLGETDTLAVVAAAHAIREGGLTAVDVVAALDEMGYEAEAEKIMAMTRARLSGDYLQTAAIFDEDLHVLSLVTDPNDYAGPGTGYEPAPPRQAEIDAIRQARGVADLRAEQALAAVPLLAPVGPACLGQDPRDVVIGVSPAVGRDVWRSLSGLTVPDVLGELLAGLEEEGCTGRVVRFNDTVDLGRIGLAAARLAGSGIGIGLQGKGTALIHRRDLAPLANLELYSVAPAVTAPLYRLLGANAARHAKGRGRERRPGARRVLRRADPGRRPRRGRADRAPARIRLDPGRHHGRGPKSPRPRLAAWSRPGTTRTGCSTASCTSRAPVRRRRSRTNEFRRAEASDRV